MLKIDRIFNFEKKLRKVYREKKIKRKEVPPPPPPLWAGVEYAHRFTECCMRRLKGCPDGSASTSVRLRGPPV